MRTKRLQSNRREPRIDEILDLHGYYQVDATAALLEFLAEAEENGYKQVKIVTGKGIHSINQQAVIKDLVEDILRHRDYEYSETKINQGGSGALLVKIKS
ncbi:MAG: Smr domain-containing protein [Parcubacteria group bacterium GW2011_GWE2_38_18]|nr:MAG: Smr domain-containing protein [Parcubacteria group bacterium GW2011_GWE2_38_18]